MAWATEYLETLTKLQIEINKVCRLRDNSRFLFKENLFPKLDALEYVNGLGTEINPMVLATMRLNATLNRGIGTEYLVNFGDEVIARMEKEVQRLKIEPDERIMGRINEVIDNIRKLLGK